MPAQVEAVCRSGAADVGDLDGLDRRIVGKDDRGLIRWAERGGSVRHLVPGPVGAVVPVVVDWADAPNGVGGVRADRAEAHAGHQPRADSPQTPALPPHDPAPARSAFGFTLAIPAAA